MDKQNVGGIHVQWNIIQPLKNEIQIHATTWTDLENIVFSKVSQTQKEQNGMIPFLGVT